MEEVKQEEANSNSTKDLTVAASSSSVSDGSCGTSHKLATVRGRSLISKRTTGPTRRSKKGGWTQSEDEALTNAVKLYAGKNWKKIAGCLKDRSDVQCLHRWQKVLNPELVKGPWTKEEDDLIIKLVEINGSKKWSAIAQYLPGRIGKQCRERWHNHLNPAIKKDAWTHEEEVTLIKAHRIYGNKWAEIARCIPGRADNSIKNHWNCTVKKKLDMYSACGCTGEVSGVKTSCSDNSRPSTGTVTSLDKRILHGARTGTCLLGSTRGNSNGGVKDIRSQPFQIPDLRLPPPQLEVSRALEEQVNYQKKPIQVFGTKLNIPVNDRSLGDTKNSSLLDELKLSLFSFSTPKPPLEDVTFTPPPSIPPLDSISSSKKIHSLPTAGHTGKRLFKSPRRQSLTFSSPNSPNGINLRPDLDSNSPSSSSLALEINNISLTQCSDVTNLSRLSSDTFLESGKISDSRTPLCSTPPTRVKNISLEGTSVESVLRNAAKSYKHTPSIIRKRGREIFQGTPHASDLDGVCTPEVGKQNSSLTDLKSISHANSGEDDLNSRDFRRVKWLSLSPSSSDHETVAAVKSVRLEHAFDMECDNPRAKDCISTVASDASCGADTRLMSVDNSRNSSNSRSESPQVTIRSP